MLRRMKANENESYLLSLILMELKRIKTPKRIIPFPMVYQRLGCIFHFRKENAKKILQIMEKENLIKVIPFHGIQIKGDTESFYFHC